MPSAVSRRAGVTAVAIALALLAAFVYIERVAEKMPDFEVYWRAGVRAAAAQPLFRPDDGHYQLKYLPAFAMLVIPLGLVPPAMGKAVWFAVSIAALALLVSWSVRLCAPRRIPLIALVLITLAVMGKFYARELVLGQVNAIFAAIAVAALLAMRSGREPLAGGLLALAVVLKPYGLLFVPWLVVRRQRASILAFAAGLAVALLLPLVRYSPAEALRLHRDWWDTVVSTTAPNLLNPDNVSWLAMYTRLGDRLPPWAPMLLWAATALIVAGLVARMWFRRDRVEYPDGLEGALLLLLIPLVSPQGWDYVLLLGTPAVVLLVNGARTLPAGLRFATVAALALMGLTIYDVMGRDAYRAFLMASGITLSTFVIIAALATLRARAAA